MSRDPTQLSPEVIGSQVEMLLGDRPTEKPKEAEKSQRKRTPHERTRAQRRMAVTFPDPGWRDAIWSQAKAWGLNASDFVTFCVSYTMAEIEAGNVEQPEGDRVFYHRSGEMLDLPWEPE